MRKRCFIAVYTAVISTLILTGCGIIDQREESGTSYEETETTQSSFSNPAVDASFEAYYYRTDLAAYVETDFPVCSIISSEHDLRKYYENNRDMYQFGLSFNGETSMAETVFSGSSVYNDCFFDKSILVFVVLEEGSGSVRHNVESILPENNLLSVTITRVLPEIGTADMAAWHIMLVLDKEYIGSNISVVLNTERLSG